MHATCEATGRAHARTLLDRYPELDPAEALEAVERAREAVALFGLLGDPDAATLWFACAEREARLRLGVDVEEARLDPQARGCRRREPVLNDG